MLLAEEPDVAMGVQAQVVPLCGRDEYDLCVGLLKELNFLRFADIVRITHFLMAKLSMRRKSPRVEL